MSWPRLLVTFPPFAIVARFASVKLRSSGKFAWGPAATWPSCTVMVFRNPNAASLGTARMTNKRKRRLPRPPLSALTPKVARTSSDTRTIMP
jgi:hypothetical protein